MQLLVTTGSLSCLFILVVNIEFIRPEYRSAIEVTGLKIHVIHPYGHCRNPNSKTRNLLRCGLWLSPKGIPRPYIQSNLQPRLNWKASMVHSLMSGTVWVKILPVYGRSRDRLEDHILIAILSYFIRLDNITPAGILRRR